MSATPESLQKFVQYCQQHLTGDEKGESQNFLDRFFQAFGHGGVKEAGATLEQWVKKGLSRYKGKKVQDRLETPSLQKFQLLPH